MEAKMFTREDFQNYFEEIKKKEEEMVQLQTKLIAEIKDEKIKEELNIILKDELRHERIIDEIEEIIKVGKPKF